MSEKDKASKGKDVNYTPEQVARMNECAALNLEKAKLLAVEFGKSPQSVISKAQFEGIAYEKAAPAPKKPQGKTKAQIVSDISAYLEGKPKLDGLEKATSQALGKLLDALHNAAASQ